MVARSPVPTLVENLVQEKRSPQPGQFVSTHDYVFFRPDAEDPYAHPSEAIAPLLETLVDANGLINHTFTNLTFSHATWRQPSAPDGYVPTQSAVTSHGEPRGAVRFERSKGVQVEGCSFSNLGTAYALEVGNASQQVTITANTFDALAGGAIKLGNVLNSSRALTSDAGEMDVGFRVTDNVVSGAALEFRGAAAIFAGYVASSQLAHNTIRDTGYTGISLGWGWGNHVVGKQTFARDNHITSNHIEGVMSALNDGGCAYTLGPQPNSTLSENVCIADNAPVVGSFYHDNGSRYFTTTRNVASGSPAPASTCKGAATRPRLIFTCPTSGAATRAPWTTAAKRPTARRTTRRRRRLSLRRRRGHGAHARERRAVASRAQAIVNAAGARGHARGGRSRRG